MKHLINVALNWK